MQEITFKDAEDARHAVITGQIQEGDYIIDDKRNKELYVYEVYPEVKSIYHVALLCYDQLYDANGCAIGLGNTSHFITPYVLAFFRVERDNDDI